MEQFCAERVAKSKTSQILESEYLKEKLTMNKLKHKIGHWLKLSALTFPLSVFIASCNNDDIVPDNPDTPTAGCHLRFSGSAGSDNATTRASWTDNNDGKLTFAWDYTLNPETATE